MQTFGLTLLLRDDASAIEQYVEHHRHVWPEVVARVREVGVVTMRIFLIGRRLFMYIETADDFDPRRDFPRLADDPASARWEALMAEFQEKAPEAADDEWWAAMEKVFDLDQSMSSSNGSATGSD